MVTDGAVTAGDAPHVVAGRYELGPVLGTGSSAVVCRAWDRQRDIEVAVKCFRPGASERDLRQQRQEMTTLADLDHPGLVRLHDSGNEDGCQFVVTDLVEGSTLAERIVLGPPLAAGAVRKMGALLADALAHVHAAGIVHRDVKPANVLLGDGTRPRLADFGIALALDATTSTAKGCVVGTAAYLAPEQVRGELVGPAADVYALGLVLLEAVTGRREFPGLAVESATARLHRSPAVPDGLPAGLGTVLTAMTRDEPRRRPTAMAVAAALSADPTSPAAGLAPVLPPQRGPTGHGRHRRGRTGGCTTSRIAMAGLTAVLVAMLTGAAPRPDPSPGKSVEPVPTAVVHDPLQRVGPSARPPR